jgi:GxxExxY protein
MKKARMSTEMSIISSQTDNRWGYYCLFFLYFNGVVPICDLKAVQNLLPEHEAQLQNYLRATKMRVGLLVNFGHYPNVEIKRIVI